MTTKVRAGVLAAAWIAESAVPAMAEPIMLVLGSGSEAARVEGAIIDMIGAMTVIGLAAGGSLTVPTGQITGVMTSVDGRSMEGDFVNWSQGTYSIRVDGQLMGILDGKPIAAPESSTDPPITTRDSQSAEESKATRPSPDRQSRWQGTHKPNM